jgi:adenylate kinase family enzyme
MATDAPAPPTPTATRRIQLIGAPCAGKSTLGALLSQRLGPAWVDLDDGWWSPGWQEAGHAALQARLAPLADQAEWIVCGNHFQSTEALLWPRLQCMIILDLPLPLLLWRCGWRTLRRGVLREPCCNGNAESLWRLFQRDGVLRYTLRTWRQRRERHQSLHRHPALQHAQIIHVRSQRDLRRWLATPLPA